MKHILLRPLWAAILLMLTPLTAFAGETGFQPGTATGPVLYQVGEQPLPEAGGGSDGAASRGPVRLARFSYVQGNITWRPSASADWSPASVNLPLRQGAQVWVTGGRAEVQFDDGSLLRLGNGAVITLQTLYSDTDGEYTEIQMNEGLAALRLRHGDSIYQVDTPFASVKSAGPSKVRVGVGESVEVAVAGGSAAVEGSGQKTVLHSGDYLDLSDAEAAYQVAVLPDADSWDRWNDDRDRQLTDADSARYLPSNIALVSGDLDDYGGWRDDARYGKVWVPRAVDAGWRPYQHGHWVWVEPFGWTWVSSEAWGWAPYHYGTWVDESYGWAWVPGPVHQYWCPAVVHFSEYNGAVAWCPLAPAEVRYPPVLSVGFHSGGWSLNFSIGGCAVYYPANDHYCAPRPFNNVVVNRTVYVNRVTNITNVTNINRNVYLTNNRFVPQNAQMAGVTTASMVEFGGGRGEYRPAPRVATAFFAQGRAIGAPPRGSAPFAGPIAVRPTAEAYTPSRTFLPAAHPAQALLQRPMFRAPLPRRVAAFAPPISHPAPRTFRGLGSQGNRSLFGSPQAGRPPFGRPQGQPGLPPAQAPNPAGQEARDARRSLGQPLDRPRRFSNVPDAAPAVGNNRGNKGLDFPARTSRSDNFPPARHVYHTDESPASTARPGAFRPGRAARSTDGARRNRPARPAATDAPAGDHGGHDRQSDH